MKECVLVIADCGKSEERFNGRRGRKISRLLLGPADSIIRD
jgi:hypothetical protein